MAKKTKVDPADSLRKQANISVQRYFEISLLLMLGTAFTTVATTGKLDLLSIVCVGVALVVRLFSYLRDRDLSLSPRTVTRIAIFYVFFFLLDFLVFSVGPTPLDSMLNATVHLVLFTTVIKVFSARTYRDYGYLATLSFLMMLSSAVLTVGSTFIAFFTLYLLAAISTFISYDIKRSTEDGRRAPEGPFRGVERNRVALERALMGTTAGLAAGIVALAALLFFVIPRYRTGYLTSMGMQQQSITGFSETVNLGDIRKIKRSPMVVMRVKPEGNAKQYVGVKWRGVGLTSFDGKHWYNDNTEQTPLQPASFQRFLLPRESGYQHRPRVSLRYRVMLSAVSTDVLFTAPVPRELTGRLRMISLDETNSLHNPVHNYGPLSYDVISETGQPNPAQLRKSSTEYPTDITLIYLRLPTMDPRVAQLAKQVTAHANNPYDRAFALQMYLRDNYGYTLDPPNIEPTDPIGSFLFKSKKGYCEYFAAAMAVMLRTLNIPSRLVNGFQTGAYNPIGRDFVVRARDAHSWVEVYFTGYGWISFDPTPPDPNPVIAGIWDDYVDALGLFWSEWIINYDFSHQEELARDVEQGTRHFQRSFRQRVGDWQKQAVLLAWKMESWLMSHKLLMFLLMVAVLTYLILSERDFTLADLRFRWAWLFSRQDMTLSPREASLTYLQLLKTLRKKGFRKKSSQTPREFAVSFVGTRLAAGVNDFTRLYNGLRYGGEKISLTRLRQVLEEIRQTQ